MNKIKVIFIDNVQLYDADRWVINDYGIWIYKENVLVATLNSATVQSIAFEEVMLDH